jgi:hypothetical protein
VRQLFVALSARGSIFNIKSSSGGTKMNSRLQIIGQICPTVAGRLLMVVLAVLTVSVSTSALASADSCTGGSHFVLCNDNQEPLVNETGLGTGGTVILSSHIGGAEAKFECTSNDFSATLEKLGSGSGLALFLNCTEIAPSGCNLSSPQLDVTFMFQLESTNLATFTGNKNGAAHEFASLVIVGCSISGSYSITGSQMAEAPEGEVSKVEHEIVGKKSQSLLRLGVETGSFSGTIKNLHLGGTAVMANLGLASLAMTGE